ncbi:MAG: carboxypeptidase regulatory-like domain-containing protein [Dehalococcoidales bacterium]|nr:carboxypeptidase regulatory-like domain-containing protein [Dehalococcoidales bacterium]
MASISGKVTDQKNNRGMQEVNIMLAEGIDARRMHYHQSTGRNGNYEITHINAGSHNIIFSQENYQEVSMSIVINSGPNTLNIQMTAVVPPTGTLTGVVTDSATGAPLQGVSVTMAGTTVTTAADGSYGFTNITPGTYTITFTKSGYTTVTK